MKQCLKCCKDSIEYKNANTFVVPNVGERRLREKDENKLKVPKPKFRQLSTVSLVKAKDPLESLAKLAALK